MVAERTHEPWPGAETEAAALPPDTPLDHAARAIVADRLKDVRRRVKQCRGRGAELAEKVHHLRSSIRKALAALELFAPALEPDRLARTRRHLERTRKAAGRARDTDVLIGLLGQIGREAGGDDADTAADAARELASARPAARAKLQRRCRRVRELRAKPLFRTDTPCGLTLDVAAASAESELRRRIDAAMRQDLSNPTCLHAVRIHLRQLRYTLEIARPGDPRIGTLKGALNDLGEVADLTMLIEHLWHQRGDLNRKRREAMDSLIARCRGELQRRERTAREHLAERPWLPPSSREQSPGGPHRHPAASSAA
jgi:CHAD domain-containing protein